MKKRNLLIPLASLVAATTPTIAITSCTMDNSKPQTLNINKDGILLGFKKGTTNAKIKKQFGNTMTIPKEVTYIAPYAFVNVPKQETTIPDFIENFVFEDGYKCEEIGQMAFAYAPFKSVRIENERQEGFDPEDPYRSTFNWSRPFDEATGEYTGWGLKAIDTYAFYKTENLEYLKLCASIETLQSHYIPAPIIGWEDTSVPSGWTTNLKTLDLSDWNYKTDASAPRKDTLPANIRNSLGVAFEDDPHYDSNCHVLFRPLDGINGGDPIHTSGQGSEILDDKNMFLNWLGQASISNPTDNSCGLWTIAPKHKMIDHLVDEEEFGQCLSTYYGGNYTTNQWYDYFTFDIDLAKWSGKMPKKWKIFVMNFEKTLGGIANDANLKLWLNEQDDEHLLSAGTDYDYADGIIVGSKSLTKTDKLIVQFKIASDINFACTYFARQ